MTEHDERPPEEVTGQSREEGDPDLRPLPDGGLGENMPEWLRRPPAWRELPGTGASTLISEPATATEAVAADVPDAEPEVTVAERGMPPIDTSVVDPKTLIDFEDLPAWLQELGSKRASAEATAEASSTDESQESETGIDVVDPAPETNADSTEHLVVSVVEQQPVQVVETGAEPPRDLAMWQHGPFIAVLVVALLAAICVAILYATGTF